MKTANETERLIAERVAEATERFDDQREENP